jgi:hypothetical protein
MALWHCPWFLLFSMLSLGWYIFELHGTSSWNIVFDAVLRPLLIFICPVL